MPRRPRIPQPQLPPRRRHRQLRRMFPIQKISDGLEFLGVAQIDIGRDVEFGVRVVEGAVGEDVFCPAAGDEGAGCCWPGGFGYGETDDGVGPVWLGEGSRGAWVGAAWKERETFTGMG